MRNQKKSAFLDANVIENAIAGRWLEIAQALYPNTVPNAFVNPGKSRDACPSHGSSNKNGKGDGFRFFESKKHGGIWGGYCNSCGASFGFEMLMFLSGKDFRSVLEDCAHHLGITCSPSDTKTVERPKPKARVIKPNQKVAQELKKVWGEAVSLDHPKAEPARLYFKNRGLSHENISDGVKFHESMPYWCKDAEKVIGRFPCILGILMNPEGEAVTIHRIFLSKDGQKANVNSPKKIMSQVVDEALTTTGASIPVCVGDLETIAITEGIEDAVAVTLATGLSSFATYSSAVMGSFRPPIGTKKIIIYADFNRGGAGQTFAAKAAANLISKGYEVEIKLPIRKSHLVPLTKWAENDKRGNLKTVLSDQGYKVVSQDDYKAKYPEEKNSLDWNDIYKINPNHKVFG